MDAGTLLDVFGEYIELMQTEFKKSRGYRDIRSVLEAQREEALRNRAKKLDALTKRREELIRLIEQTNAKLTGASRQQQQQQQPKRSESTDAALAAVDARLQALRKSDLSQIDTKFIEAAR